MVVVWRCVLGLHPDARRMRLAIPAPAYLSAITRTLLRHTSAEYAYNVRRRGQPAPFAAALRARCGMRCSHVTPQGHALSRPLHRQNPAGAGAERGRRPPPAARAGTWPAPTLVATVSVVEVCRSVAQGWEHVVMAQLPVGLHACGSGGLSVAAR